MTRDNAIEIAWNAARLSDHNAPRPTVAEALAYFEEAVPAAGFNWITGQMALECLREENPTEADIKAALDFGKTAEQHLN